jgi:predicted RNase H-like nuclease (RuvC/YqgF family)
VPADDDKGGGKKEAPQVDRKDGPKFAKEKGSKARENPDVEELHNANKLLEEEIEDEKAKLEALQKKLERLKKNGVEPSDEDPKVTKLKRENRKLRQKLKELQEEVRLAEEDVEPYLQALRKSAGNAAPAKYPAKDKGDYGYRSLDKAK